MHFVIQQTSQQTPVASLTHQKTREPWYSHEFFFPSLFLKPFKVSLGLPSKQNTYVNKNFCLDILHLLLFLNVDDQRITAFTVKKPVTQGILHPWKGQVLQHTVCTRGVLPPRAHCDGERGVFRNILSPPFQDTLQSAFAKILPVQWWRSLKKWQLTKRRSHNWEWSFCWNGHQGNQR